MGESTDPIDFKQLGSIIPGGRPEDVSVSPKRDISTESSTISSAKGEAPSVSLEAPQPPSPSQVRTQKEGAIFTNLETLRSAVTLAKEAMAAIPPEASAQPDKVLNVSLMEYLSLLSNALSKLQDLEQQLEEQNAIFRVALLNATSSLEEMGINAEKMALIAELEALKSQGEYISTGYRINLGAHPDLMLQLVKFDVIPPLVGGGPWDGSAQAMAASGTPPYDDPVYAAMAMSVGPGWEELSVEEVNQVILALERSMEEPVVGLKGNILIQFLTATAINEGMQIFRLLKAKDPSLLKLLLERQALENQQQVNGSTPKGQLKLKALDIQIDQKLEDLQSSPIKVQPGKPLVSLAGFVASGMDRYTQVLFTAAADADKNKLAVGIVAAKAIDSMIKKAIVFEAISLTSSLYANADQATTAAEITNSWLKAKIAEKMVGDLLGISTTTRFERRVMAAALNSYVLLMALAMQPNATDSKIMNSLNRIEKMNDLSFFASIAKVININRNDPVEVVKNVIFLTRQIDKNEESLEDIRLLIAMVEAMIKKLTLALLGGIKGQLDAGFDGRAANIGA